MLTIRDRSFDVSLANFGAIVSLDEDVGWHLKWYFEIQTIARRIDGTSWHPRLFAEALFVGLPAPDELPRQSVYIPAEQKADGEPNFLFYVFEHEFAHDVRITFGRWRGEEIEMTLDAKADVNWDEDFGASVSIHVECPVQFEGINVWDRNEESARSRLSSYYNPKHFRVERSRIGFNYRRRVPTDE